MKKTEILALGDNSLQESDFPKHNFYEVIKILGIYFGYDKGTTLILGKLWKVLKNQSVYGNGEASPF